MKLSACLIVKNEHDLLPRCLDSIREFDEIIITDTGSTDDTVEIAKKYTDKVYHFKWCDDFSKARNYSLSKVTGDWVLVIDADEVLKTPCKAVKSILSKEKDKKVLGVKMTAEGTKNSHYSDRIFRNLPEIKYRGVIHETLTHRIEENVDIEIMYGSSPTHLQDPDADFRLLKKFVENNPECIRERFYLAREYTYREEWKTAIKYLKDYVKRAVWLPERNEANLLMAKCYDQLKDYNKACDCAWEAIKYNTNFKEAIEFLANHMDSTNAKRWKEFSKGADNSEVLFVRSV
jgi:glycosyltransferase involved in cell wall biosynthesis